jgi:hypothetical protein
LNKRTALEKKSSITLTLSIIIFSHIQSGLVEKKIAVFIENNSFYLAGVALWVDGTTRYRFVGTGISGTRTET